MEGSVDAYNAEILMVNDPSSHAHGAIHGADEAVTALLHINSYLTQEPSPRNVNADKKCWISMRPKACSRHSFSAWWADLNSGLLCFANEKFIPAMWRVWLERVNAEKLDTRSPVRLIVVS